MAPYENYVMGMLTTYKQLPLDRLHHMLKLFVIAPKWVKDAFTDMLRGWGGMHLHNQNVEGCMFSYIVDVHACNF